MHSLRRVLVAGLVLPTALLVLSPAPTAVAAPLQVPSTDYTADVDARQLTLVADENAVFGNLLDPPLTPTIVHVDSAADPQVTAAAYNLAGSVAAGEVPTDGILSQVSQTAPPDNADAVTAELLAVPASPVADATVSTATAHARDPLAVCGTGDPVGTSTVQTVGATVLSDPSLGTVATLDNDNGGVNWTGSTVSFQTVSGQTGLAIQDVAETQIDSVTLLGGTPAEFTIEIGDTATLTATATGSPGGATATYGAPVINITSPSGSSIPSIPVANETPRDQLVDALDTITQVVEDVVDATTDTVGVADVNIDFGQDLLTVDAAADGTSVSATTAVVRIEITVLDAVTSDGLLHVVLELGRMTTSATVPAGGVACGPTGPKDDNPLRELHKDVSQAQVAPGGTFDYTLTVPNRGPCTLTDVVVTDVVSGPIGSLSADPEPSSTDGNTLTWNVGTLEPNETATFTITIVVPADTPAGTRYLDTLSATGNCDGEPVEQLVNLNHPTVATEFFGGCDLTLSNKRASHEQVTAGETFNYFIHVFNRGDQPCGNVSISDTLDDRLSFVSCTDGCAADGQLVTWDDRSIPAGSGATFTVTVAVRGDATGTLHNEAVISTPDGPSPVTVTWDGPQITDISVLATPDPPRLVNLNLPRTGGEVPLAAAVGFGLTGLFAVNLRRRMLA